SWLSTASQACKISWMLGLTVITVDMLSLTTTFLATSLDHASLWTETVMNFTCFRKLGSERGGRTHTLMLLAWILLSTGISFSGLRGPKTAWEVLAVNG